MKEKSLRLLRVLWLRNTGGVGEFLEAMVSDRSREELTFRAAWLDSGLPFSRALLARCSEVRILDIKKCSMLYPKALF